MGRSRSIDIDYDGRTWGRKGVPVALARLRGSASIDADAAILQVAHVTRPPALAPLHLANSWSWLRYFSAISSESRLSLDHTWDEIDPHQKTILSDDWGMGFATLFVQQVYNVWAWVPTGYLARYAGHLFKLHRPKAKTGPAKSPDFVGLTTRGTLVVVECKGTQTSQAFSDSQVRKGSPQKRALRIASSLQVEVSLVAGLFVPLASQVEAPRLFVVDPRAHQTNERIGGPGLRNWIIRLQLAAQMGLVGALSTQAALLDDEGDMEAAIRADEGRLEQRTQVGWVRRGRAAIDRETHVSALATMPPSTLRVVSRGASPDAVASELWRNGKDGLRVASADDSSGGGWLESPTGFRIECDRRPQVERA